MVPEKCIVPGCVRRCTGSWACATSSPSAPSLLLAFACRRSTDPEKPAGWIGHLPPRCLCDDYLLEKYSLIRVVEPEFITGTLLDSIRVLRAAGRACKQQLITSVRRNVDLPVHAVPRNGGLASPFADRYQVRRCPESGRRFADEDDALCNERILKLREPEISFAT